MALNCPQGFSRCDDGTCSNTGCPSLGMGCPVSRPVRCDDGSCVKSTEECQEIQSCPLVTDCRIMIENHCRVATIVFGLYHSVHHHIT